MEAREAGAARQVRATEGDAPQEGATRPPPRPVTVQIDFDGLQRRIVSVPGVPVRDYSQLRAGAAGIVYYVETPAGGGNSTLHRYRLSDRRAAPFVTGTTDYRVSADGHKLIYRAGGGGGRGGRAGGAPAAGPGLFVVDADRTVPQAGSGRLEVTLRMYLEPREEFKQIFKEGWRNQRDYLYVPNLHGADWTKMEEMYGQMLPHVNHRADLNYLLDNMGAEIAVGHSYVRGGDMPEVPTGSGGLLGADFTVEDSRYKIARIYDNESWNPDLRAPLHAPGVEVNVGDYVLAINGVELRAPDNIHRLLDGTANRQTRLTVNSKPAMEGARHVTVVPIATEQALRTRAWVEENRRTVEKLSGGQLAYVYVPNTGQGGYASFNRYYFAQQDKAGVVVDERYNGGGSAADYIIEVLERDVRRLLQQRCRRSSAVHQPIRRHLGSQGDDHQRDGRIRRRPDAVHVPLSQDRSADWQAHVGRSGAHGRHARIHRRRIDDRTARRVLHPRRQVGGRERRRGAGHRRRELAEGRHRRPRSATRTRRRGGDAPAQDAACRPDDQGTATADVGGTEAGRGRTVRVQGARC